MGQVHGPDKELRSSRLVDFFQRKYYFAAHVKHEFARKSKKSETIAQKRTSVMIRDQYISSVDTMYKEQMRRKKYMEAEEEEKNNKVSYNQGNLKYVFNKHCYTSDCY